MYVNQTNIIYRLHQLPLVRSQCYALSENKQTDENLNLPTKAKDLDGFLNKRRKNDPKPELIFVYLREKIINT